MSERFKPHPDAELLRELFPAVREYERLANRHGIEDIFQDNGGKLLQVLLLTGLSNLAGREGNDAVDPATGLQFELKSVNLNKTRSFSTHHHLNPGILAKYRKVEWIFATYCDIEIQEIYLVQPLDLEPLFSAWEATWNERNASRVAGQSSWDWNNPKIPVSYVRQVGERLHGAPPETSPSRRKARPIPPPEPGFL